MTNLSWYLVDCYNVYICFEQDENEDVTSYKLQKKRNFEMRGAQIPVLMNQDAVNNAIMLLFPIELQYKLTSGATINSIRMNSHEKGWTICVESVYVHDSPDGAREL